MSCSGVVVPKIETSGPNGMTASARNAGTTEMIGAMKKTALSAAVGMMSSFSASLIPSMRPCSTPNGPTRLGPSRDCMRATTRRSPQMVSSTRTTTPPKMPTTLRMTSHQGSWPNGGNSVEATTGAASTLVGITGHLLADRSGPGPPP